MASIFGHGLVAYTTSKIVDSKSGKLLILLAVISAILPDIDVLTFQFGIPYTHPFGHRGFTHSILFAVLWSFILSFSFGKGRKLIFMIVLFLATVSHGILDAMTIGGQGVGFFIPFDTSRYFFPYRVIQVSPIGAKAFFSEWGLRVLWSEFKYLVVPCVIILVIAYVFRPKNVNSL